jgi:hypothetical protein
MRHFPLSLLMVVAVAAPAAAEPPKSAEPPKIKNVKVRTHGTSSFKIGCTPQTNGISCEGLERYRIGMGSTQIAHDGKNGTGPVVIYQVMTRQSGPLLASQAIAAVGVRKVIGGGWIQGGPGIARTGVGPGPRAVGIMKTIDQPRLAAVGGVGVNLSKAEDPATLAIDFGTTIDSKDDEPQIYQIGASVVRRF